MRPEHRLTAIFSLAFFGIAVFCQPVFSQGRTNAIGTGGMHEIRGRIYLPNGRTIGTPITIRLESTNFAALTVQSDHSGGYSFRSLAPGVYTIVVDGVEGYEPQREPVAIDTDAQGSIRVRPTPKMITVPIHLRPKRSERLRNEVINAKWAAVPKDAVERYQRGILLMSENKGKEAAAEFRRSAEIFQGFAPAHSALGKYYLITGKLDEALSSLRLSLKYDPSDFETRLNCGIALLNKSELDGAEAELKAAASQNEAAVTPRFYLGLVFVQRRDLDSAQKQLEAARKLAGENDFPLIHKYLGGIYWQKGKAARPGERRALYRQAVKELEKYIEMAPASGDAGRIKETIAELRSQDT